MPLTLLSLSVSPLFSCGYEPVHGALSPSTTLSVVLATQRAPHLRTATQVGAAIRRELSRHHLVAGGEGYPRVEYEVLRVDERSAAISQVNELSPPLARGSAISVVVRAWVVEAPGGPRTRDTGDIRRVARFATQSSAGASREQYEAAISAAASRAGEAAAKRVLGEPVPADQAF